MGWATVLRGWALTEQGQGEKGIAQIHQGLATYRATGAGLGQSDFLALLAEAYGKAGQTEEGLGVLAEAMTLVDKNDERFYEAELYRIKGELTLQREARGWRLETSSPSPQASSLQPLVSNGAEREAEECFLKAIEIAQKQHAKSLELRAVMSLARLWQRQALEQGAGSREHRAESREQEAHTKLDEAHRMLSEVYYWFTEGFDTKDLQEAKALLEELNH